eukprot:599098-Prymnesium_polylepis.1
MAPRKGTKTIANFIVEFQMDNGRSTAVVLDSEDYSHEPLAGVGAWFLVREAPETGEVDMSPGGVSPD